MRPYLGWHGGDGGLVSVVDGVVRLRMAGTCDGCPSSARTVSLAVETAIRELAPEVTVIHVDGASAAPAAPIESSAPVWIDLDGRPPASGQIATAEVAGARILLCRSDGTLYAYRDRCPGCGAPLDAAGLAAGLLVCGCGQRFDVRRAGQGVSVPALQLDPIPLLEDRDGVRVAMVAA